MACDRPLQKLDADVGPFVPAQSMPHHPAADHLSSHGLPAKERDVVSRGSPRKPGQLNGEASSRSVASGATYNYLLDLAMLSGQQCMLRGAYG